MSHDHSHAPARSAEPRLAPSGHATVMLDIGDGVGALVVRTPATMCGVEIELARRNETTAFVHTEVRERRVPTETVYAGVFPAIAEGEYVLLDLAGEPHAPVTITSGRVTELDWPAGGEPGVHESASRACTQSMMPAR